MEKILFAFFSVISLQFSLFGVSVDSRGCTPGKFTSDLSAAKKYAAASNIFIVAIQGRNDGNCAACNGAASATYNTSGFKNWSKQNGIPLVYGDYVSNAGGAYAWAKSLTGETSWPQAIVCDKDGKTKLGNHFTCSGGVLVKLSDKSKFSFGAGASGFKDAVQCLIDYSNNSVAKARKIVSAKTAVKWGLYGDYGISTLRAFYAYGYRYTDPVDWYLVTAADLPKGYGLSLRAEESSVVDEKGYAQVRVFGSSADASGGTNDLAAAMSLVDFAKKGIVLSKVPEAGVYLKIFREDDLPQKEEVNIKYRLVVQQVTLEPPTEFAFESGCATNRVDEDAGTLSLSITRDGQATNVLFAVEALSNAVEGVDFDILDKDGKPTASRMISFVKTATKATLKIRINDDGGVWKGDRAFRLRLDSDSVPGKGSLTADVSIREKHARKDGTDPADDVPGGAAALDLGTGAATKAARLNEEDAADWYKVAVKKDSLVSITLTPKKLHNVSALVLSATNSAMGVAVSTNASSAASTVRFSPASAGELAFLVSRKAGLKASAVYDIDVAVDANWVKPEIAFKVEADKVDDTTGEYAIVLTRKGTKSVRDTVYVTCNTETNDATPLKSVPVAFEPGAETASVSLRLNVADNRGIWKGDRSCKVTFELADSQFCAKGVPSELALVLKETDSKYDGETDSEREKDKPGTESGAAPFYEGPVAAEPLRRRLNGDDVKDFFTFTGIVSGEVYQVVADFDAATLRHVDPDSVMVELEVPGKELVRAKLSEVNGAKYMADGTEGEIKVCVSRGTAQGGPASFRYSFGLVKWTPPVFSFEKVDFGEVPDTGSSFEVKVIRSANLIEENVVHVLATNVTPVTRGGYDPLPTARTEVVFAKDETVKTVRIEFAGEHLGRYTGDHVCEMTIDLDGNDELMRRGEPSTTRVTLKEQDAELDGNDRGDDEFAGRTHVAEIGCWPKRSAREAVRDFQPRLNGSDLVDWYGFDGLPAGTNVCIGATDYMGLATENADLSKVQVVFYASKTSGMSESYEPVGTNTLAQLLEREWMYKPAKACSIAVEVRRPSQKTVASLAYNLTCRLQPPREVDFAAEGEIKADVRASAAYVDLVLTMDGGGELGEEVVVWLTPTNEPSFGMGEDARPYEDYDPRPVKAVWAADSTGGTVRVAIPLTGRTAEWRGDRLFRVVPASEQVEIDEGAVKTVRIVDSFAQSAGSVGIVGLSVSGAASVTPSSKTTYSAAAGGEVTLVLERTGGKKGAVIGKFDWKDAATGKTVKTGDPLLLYSGTASTEAAVTNVTLAVPAVGRDGLKGKLTLGFSLVKGEYLPDVKITSKTPTSLTFSLMPPDCAGAVSGETDVTKVRFSAAESEWYRKTDGSVVSYTPAAGKETLLQTEVTGPATLSFAAELFEIGDCRVELVTAGRTVAVTNGVNEVHLGNGRQLVKVRLVRPKAVKTSTAAVKLSDVRVIPDADFNGYGTFNGAVVMDSVPGVVTMTVASNGRVSGKIGCPQRTWTFKSDTAWDKTGLMMLTAQSGADTIQLAMTNELESGWVCITDEHGGILGEMSRSAWRDRPLSQQAADALFGAPGKDSCVGYYTMSLVEPLGSREPVDEYGYGYMTLKVLDDGQLRVSGQLADGQAVSLSGELILEPEGVGHYVTLFATPSAYYGGWFAQTVSLMATNETVTAEGQKTNRVVLVKGDTKFDPLMPSWRVLKPTGEPVFGDKYFGVSGGKYDQETNFEDWYGGCDLSLATLQPDATEIAGTVACATDYAGDDNHRISLAFTAGGTALSAKVVSPNPVIANPFTTSFNRATGLFSGSLRVRYAYGDPKNPKYTVKSGVYRGVLTPWRNPKLIFSDQFEQEVDFGEGRGYFLIDGRSCGFGIVDGRNEN